MKFLIDMNLSPSWVAVLCQLDWDAAHWSVMGSPNAPDSEIIAFAAANGYVLITHDLDFGAILAVTHGRKPSVVQIRAENVSAEAIGRQTVAALRHLQGELEAGALLTIELDRTRVRLLPLHGDE
jgi:predicted nuclease of predicted toxin-antitoxin system